MKSVKYVMRWMTEDDGTAYIRMFRCESQDEIKQKINEALAGKAVLVIDAETFDETGPDGGVSADAVRMNRMWVNGQPMPDSFFSKAVPGKPKEEWNKESFRGEHPPKGGSVARKLPSGTVTARLPIECHRSPKEGA